VPIPSRSMCFVDASTAFLEAPFNRRGFSLCSSLVQMQTGHCGFFPVERGVRRIALGEWGECGRATWSCESRGSHELARSWANQPACVPDQHDGYPSRVGRSSLKTCHQAMKYPAHRWRQPKLSPKGICKLSVELSKL
jgi:hypothetical protein